MAKESTGIQFRLKQTDGTRSHPIEEIKHNDLMSKKHRKMYRTLNYFEHSLLFMSAVTGCVLMSAFVSLVGAPIEITSSAIELKICAITFANDYSNISFRI